MRMGQDLPMRWKYIEAEAKLGMPNSQFLYGAYLYNHGSIDDALEWLKAAADQHHGEAQFACAAIIFEKDGLSPESISYFEKACERDCSSAQYMYGEVLQSSKDYRQAAWYFKLAAKQAMIRRNFRPIPGIFPKFSDAQRNSIDTFYYNPYPNWFHSLSGALDICTVMSRRLDTRFNKEQPITVALDDTHPSPALVGSNLIFPDNNGFQIFTYLY